MDGECRTVTPRPGSDGPLILIVDPVPAASVVEPVLTAAGYQVESIQHGAGLLNRIAAAPPDLVLLDAAMDDPDAFAACRRLRDSVLGACLPIVIAGPARDRDPAQRAYDAGASEFITRPLDADSLIYRLRFLLRNHKEHARLADSERRNALAVRSAGLGIWEWDIEGDVAYFSPEWCRILGLHPQRVRKHIDEWFERVHPDDSHTLHAALNEHLAGDTERFEAEHRIRTRFGPYIWILARGQCLRDERQTPVRMAGSVLDISERKRAENQLVHDALHDGLTGLPNRKLFLDRVSHSLRIRERRPDYRFAVCFIDLDRFKAINDNFGHMVGDALLVEISRAIESGLRHSDTLARLGGDEFVVLFDDIDVDTGYLTLVERVQERLSQPIVVQDREFTVTASIGVALSDEDYEQAADVLRDADTAMYRAKSKGRATYEVFTHSLQAKVSEVMRIETELRHALARDQLRVFFQPIVDLRNERLTGFEALIRWQHPDQGLLEPHRFLTSAEESGVIVAIGRWLLENACRQMRNWQERNARLSDVYVTVNLSSREFARPDLADSVRTALQRSGLPAACLKLEIAEAALISNPDRARNRLNELKDIGVELSIDDFGTGFSSFGYLYRYPFNTLKIDRSFVHHLTERGKARGIIRAMVEMAHNLGMQVVAEGGETPETLAVLKELGCEFAQGFLYSRPLPPQQLDHWIEELQVD